MTLIQELKEGRERIKAAEAIMAKTLNDEWTDYKNYLELYHHKDDDTELKEMWDSWANWIHKTQNSHNLQRNGFSAAKELGIFNHNAKKVLREAIEQAEKWDEIHEHPISNHPQTINVSELVSYLKELLAKYSEGK